MLASMYMLYSGHKISIQEHLQYETVRAYTGARAVVPRSSGGSLVGIKPQRSTCIVDELKRAFDKHKPWVTQFKIQGQVYGGSFDAAGDPRLKWFQECFPGARNILELGSLEGGHSFALAALPHVNQVVAVEARADNLKRARFIQGLLKQPKVSFVQGNLERLELARLGTFDVVYCSGLLYHLPQPWKLVEQMSRVARGAYIWTHYARPEEAKVIRQGYRGRLYREWYFLFDALSGMSASSFWPTRDDLLRMLGDYGYTEVKVVEENHQHKHGPSITLAAYQK